MKGIRVYSRNPEPKALEMLVFARFSRRLLLAGWNAPLYRTAGCSCRAGMSFRCRIKPTSLCALVEAEPPEDEQVTVSVCLLGGFICTICAPRELLKVGFDLFLDEWVSVRVDDSVK